MSSNVNTQFWPIYTTSSIANADDPLANVTDQRMRNAFESIFSDAAGYPRGTRGSYKNDRLEAKYQGFKLAIEGIVSEDLSLFGLTRLTPGIYDMSCPTVTDDDDDDDDDDNVGDGWDHLF